MIKFILAKHFYYCRKKTQATKECFRNVTEVDITVPENVYNNILKIRNLSK